MLLMDELLGGGDESIAVVEHERVSVRMPEIDERRDAISASARGIDGGDGLGGRVDQHETRVALGGLLADHGNEVLSLFPASGDVGGAVDDPDEAGVRLLLPLLVHVDRGGAHEIGPPVVMRDGASQVLPGLERHAPGQHHVDGLGKRGARQEAEQQEGTKKFHRAGEYSKEKKMSRTGDPRQW